MSRQTQAALGTSAILGLDLLIAIAQPESGLRFHDLVPVDMGGELIVFASDIVILSAVSLAATRANSFSERGPKLGWPLPLSLLFGYWYLFSFAIQWSLPHGFANVPGRWSYLRDFLSLTSTLLPYELAAAFFLFDVAGGMTPGRSRSWRWVVGLAIVASRLVAVNSGRFH